MAEKLRFHLNKRTTYNVYDNNSVGATKTLTGRSIVADTGSNTKYIQKFGTPWLIKSVSSLPSSGSATMLYTVLSVDGDVLGSRSNGSFMAGVTLSVAKQCYLQVTSTGSNTLPSSIAITSDLGSITFVTPAESVPSGAFVNLYLSANTCTYYDINLTVGGARYTADGSLGKPYFSITAGLAALGGGYTVLTVLDSSIYDEELTISGAYTIQAALGQAPTITSGIGARVTRSMQHDGNDIDTAYVSTKGNDSTGIGSYSNPYLGLGTALTNIGSRTYINIMDSGAYGSLSTTVNIEPCYGQIPTTGQIQLTGPLFACGLTVIGGAMITVGGIGIKEYFDNTVKNVT